MTFLSVRWDVKPYSLTHSSVLFFHCTDRMRKNRTEGAGNRGTETPSSRGQHRVTKQNIEEGETSTKLAGRTILIWKHFSAVATTV